MKKIIILQWHLEIKKAELLDLTSGKIDDINAPEIQRQISQHNCDISMLEARLEKAKSENVAATLDEEGDDTEDIEELEEVDESNGREEEESEDASDGCELQNDQEIDSSDSTSDVRKEEEEPQADLAHALKFEPAESDVRNVDPNAQMLYRSEDEGDGGGSDAEAIGRDGEIFV